MGNVIRVNVNCVVDRKIVGFHVNMKVKFPTQGSLHLCQDLLVGDRLPTLIFGDHLEWVLQIWLGGKVFTQYITSQFIYCLVTWGFSQIFVARSFWDISLACLPWAISLPTFMSTWCCVWKHYEAIARLFLPPKNIDLELPFTFLWASSSVSWSNFAVFKLVPFWKGFQTRWGLKLKSLFH